MNVAKVTELIVHVFSVEWYFLELLGATGLQQSCRSYLDDVITSNYTP